MPYEQIVTSVKDGVGTVVLNRPEKKNALSIKLREELIHQLEAWYGSTDVSAVVIRGEGTTFSAGFDRTELLSNDGPVQRAVFETSKRYHRLLMNYPKVTIASIRGFALGGGFDLAVLCDIRVAAEDAVFGHPEIKFGAPPLATPLRHIVGEGWARDLCLSGRRIDAATALRIGLVTHLVPPADLEAHTETVVKQVLEAPAETLAITKAFFLDGDAQAFEPCFVREHDRPFEAAYGLTAGR